MTNSPADSATSAPRPTPGSSMATERAAGLPLVSCIVPVYNRERYVADALDSILAQTHRPIEVIAVDDGSTDGSAAVIQHYGDRVRYVWQPNGGPSAARNQGVRVARGAFLAFLDSDDLWHPEKLARQLARFDARPELDLCVTALRSFVQSDTVDDDDPRLHKAYFREASTGHVSFTTVLVRRAAFERVGPFNEAVSVAEDREWMLRAAECGLIREHLPQVLARYRLHDRNISGTFDRATSGRLLLGVMKAMLDRRRQHQ
jgi:glycosyltransferase involved in cell wall biosynthesis